MGLVCSLEEERANGLPIEGEDISAATGCSRPPIKRERKLSTVCLRAESWSAL